MREILFRGKDIHTREWAEGYYTKGFRNPKEEQLTDMIYMFSGKSTEWKFDYAIVDPETVGQFTGLLDKNGKKIFEGDIVTMPAYAGGKHKAVVYFKNGKKIFEGDIVTMPAYAGGKHKAVVYFKNGKFAVDGSNYSFKDIAPKRMEVIGNIYDNPELLNK